QRHLPRMLQIEADLGRGVMAQLRLDLEAAQDDLLQPGRDVRTQAARRRRIVIEAAAPLPDRGRLAERPLAGGEEIENDAEREQVAARIVADADELLGRDI